VTRQLVLPEKSQSKVLLAGNQ